MILWCGIDQGTLPIPNHPPPAERQSRFESEAVAMETPLMDLTEDGIDQQMEEEDEEEEEDFEEDLYEGEQQQHMEYPEGVEYWEEQPHGYPPAAMSAIQNAYPQREDPGKKMFTTTRIRNSSPALSQETETVHKFEPANHKRRRYLNSLVARARPANDHHTQTFLIRKPPISERKSRSVARNVEAVGEESHHVNYLKHRRVDRATSPVRVITGWFGIGKIF